MCFHSVDWPKHRHTSNLELLLEVLPALSVKALAAEHWMQDEPAQRAAETLTARPTHREIPERFPLTERNRQQLLARLGRLRQGADLRRWMKRYAITG